MTPPRTRAPARPYRKPTVRGEATKAQVRSMYQGMDQPRPERDFLWIEGVPPNPSHRSCYIGQDDDGEYLMEWTEAAGGWWIRSDNGRPRWPKRWRPA